MAQKREDFIKENLSIPKYFELIVFREMDGYYDGTNTDFDIRPVVRCPLHNEDTGSFRFHSDTDSFYCWGCGRGGDVINLHRHYMLLNNNISLSYDKLINDLYEMARTLSVDDRAIGRYKKLGDVNSVTEEEEAKKINNTTDLLRFTVEINRFISYIRANLKGEELANAMRLIYNYRDYVHGQGVSVSESIQCIKDELIKLGVK